MPPAVAAVVRLLLVLAHRPDGSETRIDPRLAKLGREPMSRNADLAAFDEPEIGELITAVTGANGAPRLLADLVLASSGVPLLVGAALRSLRDDRRLAMIDGLLTTTGDIPIALPSDVLAQLEA